MTNKEAIKALKEIKTYTSAVSLDAIDYVIKVMEKIEEAGIANPLESDCLKKAGK